MRCTRCSKGFLLENRMGDGDLLGEVFGPVGRVYGYM